ncbi:MAG: 4-hydroxy-3-methylbut-2-enyl diphosphate reductase [Dehalococcoidia bacterium]|nr:4-hydroxy-3-methylbut-2-enyl diphosphate reductase [Dehalococcoidia bacterium]
MPNLKVEKAERLGLCFGVRRAMTLLTEAVRKHGRIETLGPLAHNRLLVEALAGLGVEPVHGLDQVRGRILAITTHGTSPAVLSEIRARRMDVIDTTCPIVRRAQKTAGELAGAGYDVIIFGEAEHSEVRGLLGWTGGKGIATSDIDRLDDLPRPKARLALISQTTQTPSTFFGFAEQLIDRLGPKMEEIRLVNTLCQVTCLQQEAAVRLARRNELVIVIGGSNSANVRHLLETCSPLVETHLIESAEELEESWLAGRQRIGITAGASTPDEAVEELTARLMSL